MPSVEMRRSTRIFVPKAKDGELVKVLRSGRRLLCDSSTEFNNNQSPIKKLFPLINDDRCAYKHPLKLDHDSHRQDYGTWDEKRSNTIPIDVHDEIMSKQNEKTVIGVEEVCRSEFRVIRNVYSRKRKRSSGVLDVGIERRKFGLHFVRRKRRNGGEKNECIGDENCVLSIVIDGCAGCTVVSRLLGYVLKHLANGKVDLTRLSSFLVSAPIRNVFESFGIHFVLNHQLMKDSGVCRIFGKRQSIPLFTIDFSIIPLCFLGLHATMSFRSVRLSYVCWLNFDNLNESTHDDQEPLMCTDDPKDQMRCLPISRDRDDKGVNVVVAGLQAGKVGSRIVQHRSGVLTRSSSKRRRRSLRNRRARNPSHFVMQKANAPPVSSNVAFKRNGLSKISVPKPSSSSVIHVQKPWSSSLIIVPNSSSSYDDSNVDINLPQCCPVNILVVETEKCYRIEGAEVALDLSASNEWVLAVRKDGMTRYCLKVQKEMRPNTLNRFSHSVVWTVENGWKLEFPNRKDWIVFKELYKVCGDRNVVPTSPVVKNIPVPGVSEVADFWGSSRAYERPESYIRMCSDELSRILSRGKANYDMDSDDEVWLNELNNGLDEPNWLTEENFELMIDAFEKASYCFPEGVNDEKVAVSLCLALAGAEVIIPMYRYWTKRRQQKRVPLLRVFELNQPRRAQLITKPVLRKKRSLKRATATQQCQRGRGKDSSILQAMAVEQTILEEQHAVLRVQEARVSAGKLEKMAILKRQRAQFLMENADLAMYRATIALRIADSATQAVDSQQAASNFLD